MERISSTVTFFNASNPLIWSYDYVKCHISLWKSEDLSFFQKSHQITRGTTLMRKHDNIQNRFEIFLSFCHVSDFFLPGILNLQRNFLIYDKTMTLNISIEHYFGVWCWHFGSGFGILCLSPCCFHGFIIFRGKWFLPNPKCHSVQIRKWRKIILFYWSIRHQFKIRLFIYVFRKKCFLKRGLIWK